MDNLKFACEFNDSKGNETGETIDEHILVVYTYNRLDIKYSMVITDCNKIQYPKIFLLPSACVDVIIEQVKTKLLTYTYDKQLDVVNVTLDVYGNYSIKLILGKDLSSILGTEARVSRLEISLQSVIDYEIIDQHIYPSWDTYEQFKELPTNKYFTACDNIRSMYKEVPVSHLDQIDGVYYQLMNEQYSYFDGRDDPVMRQFDYRWNHQNTGKCNSIDQFVNTINQYKYYLSTMNIYDPAYNYLTKDVKYYERYEATNPKTDLIKFSNSLEVKSYKFKIQQLVMEYIGNYVFGWFLTNSSLCFARKMKLDIIISNNTLTINILRSKELQMPFIEYKPTYMLTHIMLPVVNSIKYDKYLIRYL